jgi:diacylglycerol kinase
MKTTSQRRPSHAHGRETGRPSHSSGPASAFQRANSTTPPAAPAEHTLDARIELATRPVPPRPGFFRSFFYAGRGLWYALRTQRNARVHVAFAVAAVALGVALRITPVEFAMIFVAITSVFIAEMFNTVAEACVDLATEEYHPLARIAKDVAAGAVLLSALLAVVIGLFVFIPHLWPLLAHQRR